jgi:3-oxoadipate enol-lactonase
MSENSLVLDLRYRDGDLVRTADGREFYYEQYGEGGPHLTFVNNFFLIAPMWRTFTSRLAERNRILTYDLRNQGASSSDPGEVKWSDHIGDLASVLDGAGIERTYLVGTSISALICRDFAIAHPERVCGLLLIGPTCRPGDGLRRHAVTRSWSNSLENGGPAALWDHLYSMVFGEGTMEALGTTGYLGLRETFTSLHSVDIVLANLRSSLQASDDPALLRAIACPTLLLVGEEDFLWSRTAVEETEHLIKDVTTAWFPSIGHLPYLEDTAAFESAVQSFIDQVEQSGDDVLPRLRELLREVVGGKVELPAAELDQRPLTELGLNSWAFVALLTSIEREFDIQWDVEIPMGSLRSLSAIAAYLGALQSPVAGSARSAAGPQDNEGRS